MTNDQTLTKDAILNAAEQVLRRFGPDKTSVVDIAKVLQVSHGTLYRHFASKSALREAVTERWLQTSIADPLEEIVNKAEGSAAERLHLWLQTLVNAKWAYSRQDEEMFTMYAAVTLDAAQMIKTHVNGLIQQLARIIDEGIKAEAFKPGNPEGIAKAIFTATSRFHHPAHAHEWTTETLVVEFEAVWNLLLSGIA